MATGRMTAWIRRNALAVYFAIAFGISWLAALAVVLPAWLNGGSIPKMTGLMMFPAMLLGPSAAGITMAVLTRRQAGLRDLFMRIRRSGPIAWLPVILLPPAAVLLVLLGLSALVSPKYSPNHFWIGFGFGVAAGFFEEIGWTGFAFPAMTGRRSPVSAAVLLGILWALWHLPVIDFLGSATPHGRYLVPFFLAFAFAMTALRVIIGWTYMNTGRILPAQAIHAASTGSLAALGPAGIASRQEALWYALYGAVLWIVVVAIVIRCGSKLRGE